MAIDVPEVANSHVFLPEETHNDHRRSVQVNAQRMIAGRSSEICIASIQRSVLRTPPMEATEVSEVS